MKKLIYTIAGISLLATSCETIQEGYMSENVYYMQNPYTVEQGSTVNSAALELDMSTTPVTVKLLDIRNVVTGVTEEAWYGNSMVTYWNQAPSIVSDTTLELLQQKYTLSEYPIFKVNEIGGRLEFSRGTENVPLGEYEIDVVVTNMRETRYIYNACNIILTAPTEFIDPISMDGGTQGTSSGTDNLCNVGLFRSGATWSNWVVPYNHYEFMNDSVKTVMNHALDSVITQYEDYIVRENYMEQNEDGTWSYRKDLSWVIVKFTDANRAAFKWYRNHAYSYKMTKSYEEIYDVNGNPVKSEISPVFDGDEIDATYKPFEHYAPWLQPIYGGDFLICPYPVSPYPATNIKEDMTYTRYSIARNALRSDINGYMTWLVNYVVAREGMYVVEIQADGTHSLTPNEETETNKPYSGQIFRS